MVAATATPRLTIEELIKKGRVHKGVLNKLVVLTTSGNLSIIVKVIVVLADASIKVGKIQVIVIL